MTAQSPSPAADAVPRPRLVIGVESAKSAVRVAVAKALATALVTGFDNAHEEGRSLSELQQIDVLQMAMHAFGEATETCANLETEATLMQFLRPTNGVVSARVDEHGEAGDQ